MNRLDERMQVLFEIVMSVGTSLDLQDMLRRFSRVALKRLDCTALVVLGGVSPDRLETVMSLPRRFTDSSRWVAARAFIESSWDDGPDGAGWVGFPAVLPLDDGACFHVFDLPDFGVLVLERSVGPLDDEFARSFEPVAGKLAMASVACLAYEDLEGQVLAKTGDLVARNRELDSFAHSVAHDLKAPLRSIGGFSEILGKRYADVLDERGRRYLQSLEQNADRMGHLVDTLLAYAEMGDAIPEFVAFDIHQLVDELISSRSHQVETAGIEVEVELPFTEVVSDPVILGQVLGNLFDNAVKFLRRDVPGTIRFGGDERDDCWEVWVADNGIGIDPADQQRIFEMFQRLTRDVEGTGIGLSLVRRGVERLGATIEVTSAEGEGACFLLTLPKHHLMGVSMPEGVPVGVDR